MFDIDELIDWYRAQLDDDERVARSAAASGGALEWIATPDGCDRSAETDGGGRSAEADGAGRVATASVEVGQHIARHSPAQVLREIEAKRQLLDSPHCTERLLRLMLLPYAGRTGYTQEWGPGDEWYYAQPATGGGPKDRPA